MALVLKLVEERICVWCKKPIEIQIRTNRKYHPRCYLEKVKKDKEEWKKRNPSYDKEYYQRNKVCLYKKNKKWAEENPEKTKEYKRNWARANKRKIKRSKKKYRENNKEKIREIGKKYYNNNNNNNKDKYKENQRKWRKENPEKYSKLEKENKTIYSKRHPEKVKARNKSAYHIKIPQGQLCQRCNKELAVERHHRDYSKPLEVEFFCRKCHNNIHNGQR